MRKSQTEKIPPLRTHKARGRCYVYLDGKQHYLGPGDDPETQKKYDRLTAVWLANGRMLPDGKAEITIDKLCDGFEAYAAEHYRGGNEPGNYKRALEPLRALWGSTPARRFGPNALRTVRERYIGNRWCRTQVNRALHRVRFVFKWGVGRELIPQAVHQALCAVEALRRGDSTARETPAVKPVPIEHVDALQPHVSKQVWAIIQLQLRTGARAGELVGLRPIDIKAGSPVWTYKPAEHKTAHRGIERRIYFGPVAQEVIRPFLAGRRTDAPLFSPREAEADRLKELHKRRKTPLSCGNGPGRNKVQRPKRQAGETYTTGTYARAITRGCEVANVPHWHPHQLRHLATDLIEREFGMIAAQVMLGHTTMKTTAIYKSRDEGLALQVAEKIG